MLHRTISCIEIAFFFLYSWLMLTLVVVHGPYLFFFRPPPLSMQTTRCPPCTWRMITRTKNYLLDMWRRMVAACQEDNCKVTGCMHRSLACMHWKDNNSEVWPLIHVLCRGTSCHGITPCSEGEVGHSDSI